MSGWSLLSKRPSGWGGSPAWKEPGFQPPPRTSISPDRNGKTSRSAASLDHLGRGREERCFALRGGDSGVDTQQSSLTSNEEKAHARNDVYPAAAQEGITALSGDRCQVSGSGPADAESGLNGVNGTSTGANGATTSEKVILNSKWEEDDPRNWWNKLVAEDVEAVSKYRKVSMGDMSLEVVESLTEHWSQNKRTVVLAQEAGLADSDPIRPMWVGIYQEPSENTAALYATVFPIVDESLSNFVLQGIPQTTLQGCTFDSTCDSKFGKWRNFFVGVKGSVCGLEEHVFWPNWLYHNSRCMMNFRGWNDLGEFLADPTEERIVSHLENTKRFQEDRGYHEGWAYYRMRDRWGQECLKRYGIDL
ncbi:hypothetical protein BSKO_10981 [Bryopsis sp. KO-2023]|nr:hypothetical protein BSKO_10981 [Bryopsis sp. KO-2023]